MIFKIYSTFPFLATGWVEATLKLKQDFLFELGKKKSINVIGSSNLQLAHKSVILISYCGDKD